MARAYLLRLRTCQSLRVGLRAAHLELERLPAQHPPGRRLRTHCSKTTAAKLKTQCVCWQLRQDTKALSVCLEIGAPPVFNMCVLL